MDQPRLERLLTALHRTDGWAPVLRRLCTVCVEQIGVDGAAVSRVVSGEPVLVEASDDEFAVVGALQSQVREGPCYDALMSGTVASEPNLSSPDAGSKWPKFSGAANERGISAAFAFPLVKARAAEGTFDMYNRRAGSLGTEQNADARMLADLASLAIDHADRGVRIEGTGIWVEPDAAWAYSAIVHNACGMLSEQLGVTVEAALLRLRALAFVQTRSVDEIARAVVARELRVEAWGDDD